jgi:hypothetical protein
LPAAAARSQAATTSGQSLSRKNAIETSQNAAYCEAAGVSASE